MSLTSFSLSVAEQTRAGGGDSAPSDSAPSDSESELISSTFLLPFSADLFPVLLSDSVD
ncbi:hypothetical protein U1Q18_049776, partial [Sarracenia purpurea var. burkii]